MLAQFPQSTTDSLGGWLVAFAALTVVVVAVMNGILAYRKLTTPARPRVKPLAARYVTKEELDKLEGNTKQELQRIETSLSQQMTKNEDYSHRRFHELADAVNAVSLQMAVMPVKIREAIDAAATPLAARLEKTASQLTDLAIRLEAIAPHRPSPE